MLVFCLMAPESLEWSFTLGGKVWLGNPEPLIFKSCRDRSLLIQNKAVVKRMKLTIGLVIPIVLMGWSIQEHQSKDIQVPHAIDACEKGAVHLDCDTTPLPMAFGHLWGRKKKKQWHWTEAKKKHNTNRGTNRHKNQISSAYRKSETPFFNLNHTSMDKLIQGLLYVSGTESGVPHLGCTSEPPGECLFLKQQYVVISDLKKWCLRLDTHA